MREIRTNRAAAEIIIWQSARNLQIVTAIHRLNRILNLHGEHLHRLLFVSSWCPETRIAHSSAWSDVTDSCGADKMRISTLFPVKRRDSRTGKA